MQITGSPSALRPWYSVGAIRPVSNTIRLQSGAFANSALIALGEVVVLVSSTTPPSPSTTQICVSFIDTSNPLKYSMTALLLPLGSRSYPTPGEQPPHSPMLKNSAPDRNNPPLETMIQELP